LTGPATESEGRGGSPDSQETALSDPTPTLADNPEKTGMRNAWGRVAEAYDGLWTAGLLPYTARGLDLLAPEPAWRGLDVACGPGSGAAALAGRLPGGSVLGVDFAPPMVERATALHARPGLSFAVDDAERLSQEDAAYDCVTCCFGLMFCYDARAALAGIRRVLRPGGRAMLTVWGRAGRTWWSPVIELIETRAAYYAAVCPMMFFYGLPRVLPRMLEEVGLEVVHDELAEEPMRFASVGQAVDTAILGGPLAGLFANRLSPEQQDEVRAAMTDHVTAIARTEDGVVLAPAEVRIIVARRPG
jgi:ubiquinone/menaquinone biosynthesis C-methylase UbiE